MTARVVNLSDIEERIAYEYYITGDDIAASAIHVIGPAYKQVDYPYDEAKRLTVCMLILHNGFTLVGTSACVSIETFNAEVGRKYAREDALKKMWPVEGYLLMEQLHREAQER